MKKWNGRPWIIKTGKEASNGYEAGHIQYWSNANGWTSKNGASRFSSKEKKSLNLPINGTWVKA